jgi:hypothetical protein
VTGLGRALIRLICIAGAIALVSLIGLSLIKFVPILILGFIALGVAGMAFDPKLIILVDDGQGGSVWVSLFTWYE